MFHSAKDETFFMSGNRIFRKDISIFLVEKNVINEELQVVK